MILLAWLDEILLMLCLERWRWTSIPRANFIYHLSAFIFPITRTARSTINNDQKKKEKRKKETQPDLDSHCIYDKGTDYINVRVSRYLLYYVNTLHRLILSHDYLFYTRDSSCSSSYV